MCPASAQVASSIGFNILPTIPLIKHTISILKNTQISMTLPPINQPCNPFRLKVLSWNVDMDTEPIAPRAAALIRTIRREAPHVVCLQELTEVTYNRIINALCKPRTVSNENMPTSNTANVHPTSPPSELPPMYDMHCPKDWSDNLPYFCAMLTRYKIFSAPPDFNAVPFVTSKMFRGYIHVTGTLSPHHKISMVTSHLESLQQSSQARKQQLVDLLEIQRECVENGMTTIIAADTNLRENEVPARLIQKTPINSSKPDGEPRRKKSRVQPKFQDAWILNGMDSRSKFTWDMAANDNLDGFSDFKPKARYDRAFILSPEHISIAVSEFKLLGKQRLECEKFISDHWGLCFTVDLNDTSNSIS